MPRLWGWIRILGVAPVTLILLEPVLLPPCSRFGSDQRWSKAYCASSCLFAGVQAKSRFPTLPHPVERDHTVFV